MGWVGLEISVWTDSIEHRFAVLITTSFTISFTMSIKSNWTIDISGSTDNNRSSTMELQNIKMNYILRFVTMKADVTERTSRLYIAYLYLSCVETFHLTGHRLSCGKIIHMRNVRIICNVEK